jgi:hypothetical protein
VSSEERLMEEIFALAYHLHWSRDAILTLPTPERRRYLQLLEEQLQREREAMKGNNAP